MALDLEVGMVEAIYKNTKEKIVVGWGTSDEVLFLIVLRQYSDEVLLYVCIRRKKTIPFTGTTNADISHTKLLSMEFGFFHPNASH